MIKFNIIYRTGGTQCCKWQRVSGVFTKAECVAKCAEIERMGYKTLAAREGFWDEIGLPEGWDFETWRRDRASP